MLSHTCEIGYKCYLSTLLTPVAHVNKTVDSCNRIRLSYISQAGLAQLVEPMFCKHMVMGSSPLAGSTPCMKGVARFEGRNAIGSGVHSGSSLFPTKLLTLTRCLGLSLTRAASGKQPLKSALWLSCEVGTLEIA